MSTPKSEHSRWFSEEIQPHESALRSYLRATFPTIRDVDDLVQDSYARLWRARQSGSIAYAKAFLFTTARNAALDLFRRRQVVEIEPAGDLADLTVFSEGPDAAEAASKQQELDLLAQAVRELPERCRQVLTLRLLYAMPQKEIAAQLQITEHTVKAQLAKGMKRCAEFLESRGVVGSRGAAEIEELT